MKKAKEKELAAQKASIETRLNAEHSRVREKELAALKANFEQERNALAVASKATSEQLDKLKSLLGKEREEIERLRKREGQVRKESVEQATKLADAEKVALSEKHAKELSEQRRVLDEEHNKQIVRQKAEHNRKNEQLLKHTKDLERRLEQKTASEYGDGGEIDLYEELRNEFLEDEIERLEKGKAGPDIIQVVIHKGEPCGKIIYDSKNRKSWKSEYAKKLIEDKSLTEADHALLTTCLGFPGGKKELCVESGVIIVNPARAIYLVKLIRNHMIRMHVMGLSLNERDGKMTELYKYICSDAYQKKVTQLQDLATQLLELDIKEESQHKKMWAERGRMLKRLERTIQDVNTETTVILEGVDTCEPSESSPIPDESIAREFNLFE